MDLKPRQSSLAACLLIQGPWSGVTESVYLLASTAVESEGKPNCLVETVLYTATEGNQHTPMVFLFPTVPVNGHSTKSRKGKGNFES